MDSIILTNALVAVGTGSASADRDISNRLLSVSWSEKFDEHDVTTMGSTNRVRALGLGESSIDLEVMQSYSTADVGENVDSILQTLRDLSATGKKFLVRFRPVAGARNGSNPEYSMLCVMSGRNVVDGKIGDPQKNKLTFLSAGDVLRVTTSS